MNMKMFGSLVLMLAVALMFAKGQTAGTGSNGKQPFSLTISTSTAEVQSGKPIGITIRLSNMSHHPIDLSNVWFDYSENVSFDYVIRDSMGTPVKRRKPSGPTSSQRDFTLKPGETDEENIEISKTYDMTLPGLYTIQVTHAASADSKDVVKSNMITVKVVPAS